MGDEKRTMLSVKKEPLVHALMRNGIWKRHPTDPSKDDPGLITLEMTDPAAKEVTLIFLDAGKKPATIEFIPGQKLRNSLALVTAYSKRNDLDNDGLAALNEALYDNPGGWKAYSDPDKQKQVIVEAGARLKEAMRVLEGAKNANEFRDKLDELRKTLPQVAGTGAVPTPPKDKEKESAVPTAPKSTGGDEMPMSALTPQREIDRVTELAIAHAKQPSPMSAALLSFAEQSAGKKLSVMLGSTSQSGGDPLTLPPRSTEIKTGVGGGKVAAGI